MNIDDQLDAEGELHVTVYDTDVLREYIEDYDSLTKEEKLERLQELDIEPESEAVTGNVTCIEFAEWVVDMLDRSQTLDRVHATHLDLGRSSTAPTTSDRSLNDYVDSVGITQYGDEGDQVRLTTFVDEGEANVDTSAGETISEGGITAEGYFLNHGLLPSDVSKDNSKTMTVEVILSLNPT